MLDASNGWAMTPWDTNFPLLLSTTDGGENWKDRIPRAARKGKFMIQDFHFFDPQNGWVCVYDPKYLNEVNELCRSPACCTRPTGANHGHFLQNSNAVCRRHWFFHDHETNADEKAGNRSSIIRLRPAQQSIFPPARFAYSVLPRGESETVAYYPPAKVIIPNRRFIGEPPKNAVALSVSTNLGKTWCA